MIQYKLTLSRYKNGQLRLSTPQWVGVLLFEAAEEFRARLQAKKDA